MASSAWHVAEKYPPKLDVTLGTYPKVIRQLAHNRGFSKKTEVEQFINVSYKDALHDPFLFRDMEAVVRRITEAKDKKESVTIYGDYDADGIDGSAILAKVFDALQISFTTYIPHRLIEGYGLNTEAIEELARKKTDLLITVDCGISNSDEISLAKERGMDVIITDHHQALKGVPEDAFAILHPHIRGETYPFKELTGGGVAFKLAEALILRNTDVFSEGHEKWLLDLAAIATIADYGKLIGENRALVKYGLIVFNKTKNEGLRAMKSTAGLKRVYSPLDVAMKVIPLINAAGRMNHAVAAYEALIQNDPKSARQYASVLSEENKRRREASDAMYKEALLQARKQEAEKLIVVKNKKWPITLVGIVATRIMNEFGKPTLAIGNKKKLWAGSGRSNTALYDISKTLLEHKHFFEEFGGHTAAGGFTIKKDIPVTDVVQKVQAGALQLLEDIELVPTIDVETEISLEEIDEDLIDWLIKLKPYGAGNPHPRFLIKRMHLDEVYPLGKNGNHMKLMVPKKNGGHLKCIFFNGSRQYADVLKSGVLCDAVVELDYNEWMGKTEIQVKIIDIKV